MKLFKYITEHPDIEEFTVWDKDYDIEIYFGQPNFNLTPYDEGYLWDTALHMITQVLTVSDPNDTACVTVNLSELIERAVKNEKKLSELFYSIDIDDIMDDIENIFAGYVSDKWMYEFASCLQKEGMKNEEVH